MCMLSHSVMSNSLQPRGLLCTWDFLCKNIGVHCYFLLQGIFPTQGSNLHLLWQTDSLPLSQWEALEENIQREKYPEKGTLERPFLRIFKDYERIISFCIWEQEHPHWNRIHNFPSWNGSILATHAWWDFSDPILQSSRLVLKDGQKLWELSDWSWRMSKNYESWVFPYLLLQGEAMV